MGFLNKAFRKGMKKQVAQMPRRGGGFGNLGEAIRRLNEQRGGDMGMPRMPRIDDGRMRAMPIGPGARLQMPNFGEQMPTLQESRQALARKNPTARRDPSALERLPMGNMPDLSQIDMSQLDLSGIPQSISQMNLPQMPEGLPSMEEIQGNRRMPQMGMGEMQPRMMMAEGDEVINIIDALQEYGLTVPREVAEQLSRKSGLSLQSINEIINEGGRTISDIDRQQTGRTISDLGRGRTISDLDRGRTISDMDRQMGFKAAGSIGSDDQGNPVFPEYSGGGYVNGYAEGDEVMMAPNGGDIESMLSGMDSGEQEAMGELEQMAPEMEMIDQLVMMVVQMIQQGAGEEQVISFLREQGLDDEDIGTVLQLVAEMAETEEVAAQNEIGADLEQLG
jgi:hypothetical protein